MNKLQFPDKDILELKKLLEEREKEPIEDQRQLSGVWLYSNTWETELRLLLLSDIKIIVSRVCFKYKRQGTMTAVLDWMIHFCNKNRISKICIQSVETKEMAAFCIAKGFHPDSNASMQGSGGFIIGDYILELRHM